MSPQPPYVIEAFDPARHDRAGFSCGVAAVDNYFKKTANKLAEAGNCRHHALLDASALIVLVDGEAPWATATQATLQQLAA